MGTNATQLEFFLRALLKKFCLWYWCLNSRIMNQKQVKTSSSTIFKKYVNRQWKGIYPLRGGISADIYLDMLSSLVVLPISEVFEFFLYNMVCDTSFRWFGAPRSDAPLTPTELMMRWLSLRLSLLPRRWWTWDWEAWPSGPSTGTQTTGSTRETCKEIKQIILNFMNIYFICTDAHLLRLASPTEPTQLPSPTSLMDKQKLWGLTKKVVRPHVTSRDI